MSGLLRWLVVRRSPHSKLAATTLAHGGLVVLVMLGVFHAWQWRGMMEDGFIYLRVAENFAAGHGLVFNPGERLGAETNTDFLWTLLVAAVLLPGLDPVFAMIALGLTLSVASFCLVILVARRLFPATPLAPHVAVGLLAANHSYAGFAANGFGTMLIASCSLLVLLALVPFVNRPSVRRGVWLGLALAALLLCRLDAVLLALPAGMGVVVLAVMAWRRGRLGDVLPACCVAGAIPAVTLGCLLAWKQWYYGDILPATYYAKLSAAALDGGSSRSHIVDGAGYLLDYWWHYGLVVVGALAALGWHAVRDRAPRWRRRRLLAAVVLGCVVLSQGYMLRTGGDHYEYRLLSHHTPMLMLLLAPGIAALRLPLIGLVLGATAAASAWYVQDSRAVQPATHVLLPPADLVDPERAHLAPHAVKGVYELLAAGHALRALFGHLGDFPDDVRAATVGVGAKAYYSRLDFVEMHGITHRDVIDAGLDQLYQFPDAGVAHRLIAKPMLLAELGVNMIVHVSREGVETIDFVGSPDTPDQRVRWAARIAHYDQREDFVLPSGTKLFSLPVRGRQSIPVLYIKPSATIDAVLAARGIEAVPVVSGSQ